MKVEKTNVHLVSSQTRFRSTRADGLPRESRVSSHAQRARRARASDSNAPQAGLGSLWYARPLFAQSLTELSWKGAAVTSLAQSLKNDAAANPRAPKPVRVTFAPKRNVRYCSRFRFDVHHGESFDVVLQGAGSYEEDVLPRHVRVAGRNR